MTLSKKSVATFFGDLMHKPDDNVVVNVRFQDPEGGRQLVDVHKEVVVRGSVREDSLRLVGAGVAGCYASKDEGYRSEEG